MVTQIVFKNGVQLVVWHDAPTILDKASMQETYKAKKCDGSPSCTVSFNSDEVLYKMCFANEEDYLDSIPV